MSWILFYLFWLQGGLGYFVECVMACFLFFTLKEKLAPCLQWLDKSLRALALPALMAIICRTCRSLTGPHLYYCCWLVYVWLHFTALSSVHVSYTSAKIHYLFLFFFCIQLFLDFPHISELLLSISDATIGIKALGLLGNKDWQHLGFHKSTTATSTVYQLSEYVLNLYATTIGLSFLTEFKWGTQSEP